ncbi:uncharacterized protein C1orf131-like [Halichondria panicea]|uniref:uncharacterized protein C1orf131-like n=1 Tax=Halichondria panicea TaxID=6063 RepID=UPI00312B7640
MTKEPELIVFQEPVSRPIKTGREAIREREKFLRGNVSDVFSSIDAESIEMRDDESLPSNDLDLKATLREVQSLALSTLAGKERRRFEENQLKSLGARPPKTDYVPYPHYQRVSNAQREKEKRLNEELRLTQMGTGKVRKEHKPKIPSKGRWKERITSLEPAVGKFRGGVLKLAKQDLTNLKHKR